MTPTVPSPPTSFGSYRADDVTFLLTNLTGRMEESSLSARDANLRAGGHYSELLPEEYEPSEDYMVLFRQALERNARTVARAIATSAERVLQARDRSVVIVSLARAGTPVGLLMRRYLLHRRGLDAPHYSVSIIRGRGIDRAAINWIRQHHVEAHLQFVDGWTGKGAIQRELSAECRALGLDDRLAVAADPGFCAALPGTREDVLIPSACLNSTVSGLVSRTVLRHDLIAHGQFHGAKVYDELRDRDVSYQFIDAIAAHFDDGVEAEARELALRPIEPPSWAGWTAIEAIGSTFGIDDPNRIKPGLGETTRVLLRRTPELVLVRGDGGADTDHLIQLAAERSVAVERFDEMPFATCGLVRT